MSVFDIREPWQDGVCAQSMHELNGVALMVAMENKMSHPYAKRLVLRVEIESREIADAAIRKMMGK